MNIVNYHQWICCRKPSKFFRHFNDEDLCMVDYFSGKGEAHQAFSQKPNFLNIDGDCCSCSWLGLNIFRSHCITHHHHKYKLSNTPLPRTFLSPYMRPRICQCEGVRISDSNGFLKVQPRLLGKACVRELYTYYASIRDKYIYIYTYHISCRYRSVFPWPN